MSEGTQRRLAAIVSADVVGYSRLMGIDEAGTLQALRAHRAELIDSLIAEHGGRIVKTMGDGLLLEFPSVVEAVKSAIAMQDGMAARNEGVADDKRIVFRFGINLGDIIIEGEDILGDGVNVAARLQEISEPGGIAISRRVHEDVRDRLDASFVNVGEQSLKNIARPVQVWRWSPAERGTPTTPESAAMSLPLPAKPSIAVLPFENMSNDPQQEFFGDGLAEDVITTLSKISNLFIIARNSSFAYKGQATDIRHIARELGVKYVLEGSVRAIAERIRVTAQLIDSEDGHHLWAERYDRKIEDIFAIQDEITREIVTALRIQLSDGEQAQLVLKGTESVEAWSYAMPALDMIMSGTPGRIAEARQLLQRAIEVDPKFSSAYALIGFAHAVESHFGFTNDVERSERLIREFADQALVLDPNLAIGHLVAALAASYAGHLDEAVKSGALAVKLSPSDAFIKIGFGRILVDAGCLEEAEMQLREAMRLNPFAPVYYFGILANALEMQGRNNEAIELLETALARDPNYFSGQLRIASLLGLAGRLDEARHHAHEALRINPRFDRASVTLYYRTGNAEALARFVDGLRKAGMPLKGSPD